ncbi:MAG: uridylate kinase [Archaeoglobi archaeon]|nr:UMP kinase [Candidatus Mnemosynella bozhongmuii]MDI3502545.1 uridylate kinase [Archaeoglobi archaeon]MDK2781979.1 uridylate kinase [Archaeoglobi archaeon]
MKIVISIGGSVLTSEFSVERFRKYASVLKELSSENELVVVVGGGKIARDYISISRELGANEAFSDLIGIEVTRLNARLLISALGDRAYPEPLKEYTKIPEVLEMKKIAVMGGVSPGQTTDAVAAVAAEFIGADLLVNATSVDGVYTSDPQKDPSARKIERMSAEELVRIVMSGEMKAGLKAVIDPLAAKIIERSRIRTIVMDGRNPENLKKIFSNHGGTEIV